MCEFLHMNFKVNVSRCGKINKRQCSTNCNSVGYTAKVLNSKPERETDYN